jgi:hypothetical protein
MDTRSTLLKPQHAKTAKAKDDTIPMLEEDHTTIPCVLKT